MVNYLYTIKNKHLILDIIFLQICTVYTITIKHLTDDTVHSS